MGVYLQKDRKAYTYCFEFRGRRYKGSTGQLDRKLAEEFERREQTRVRKIAAGLTDIRDAPPFAEWAGVYVTEKETSPQRRVKRPEMIDWLVRVALRFFGRKPSKPEKVIAGAPYHDLTLADPILEPEWLDRFETWMEEQRYSGSHRNHLRTQISGMYRTAMLPKYRKVTGVTLNPMEGVPRDRRVIRRTHLSVEQLRAWLSHASYHVRLAMAIAALAPKLRMRNVLDLEWRANVAADYSRITVYDHKTDGTGVPIVQEISDQLRAILKDAAKRNRGRWVVSFRGKHLQSIRDGVRLAAERANITYGRSAPDGATFHTIRHAVATWLAEMADLTEPQRAALLAHADIATTQGYTHLRPVHERQPLERLSAQTPLEAIVTQPWKKWRKGRTPIVGPMARDENRGDPRSETQKNSKKSRAG